MKFKGILQRIFLCLCLCLLFTGMQTYAEETVGDTDEGTATETNRKTEDNLMRDDLSEVTNGSYGYQMEYGVENWNRRIYKLAYQVYDRNSESGDIRVYAGKNFHITDSKGNILSEGTYIDADGNLSEDFKGGEICRDINGWFILWKDAVLNEWGIQEIYVQADSDFVGGNNQIIGVEGMSGVYLHSDSAVADKPLHTIEVNVAAEVDASDVVFPVMQGMDLSQSDFLNKAAVKMECVYGNLKDLPLKVQWYRVINGVEEPVGDMITNMPYHLPEDEAKTLTEAKEYKVKIYYNGEASTEDAKCVSDGHEVSVSEDTPIQKLHDHH